MRIRYFMYAFSLGLFYRLAELQLIKTYTARCSAYSPATYFLYGFAAIVVYIFFTIILRIFIKTGFDKDKRNKRALVFTVASMLWLSISVNYDLSFIHGVILVQTSDWLYSFLYNLGITFIPFLIIGSIAGKIFTPKTKSKSPKSQAKHQFQTDMLSVLLIIGIFFHSILMSFIIPPKIRLLSIKLPNIILLTVDTLRKDHISLYGYPRKTTPNLDENFNQGYRFNRCIATLPETGPNYASIFTGLYPFEHRVFANGIQLDTSRHKISTLGVELQKAGYHTVSHLTTGIPGKFSNLDYGIDELYQHGMKIKHNSGFDLKSLVTNLYYCYKTFILDRKIEVQYLCPETQRAIQWLNCRPKEPFFVHIYLHWPHEPYGDRMIDLPKEFSNDCPYQEPFADSTENGINEIRKTRNNYDNDIYYTDIQIGAIVEALKKLEYWDESLIIFTADHGEDLGERIDDQQPYFGHSKWLYESASCVPLIFIPPNNALENEIVIDNPVSSVDIAPSILTMTGLFCPSSMQGVSLFTIEYKIRRDLNNVRPWAPAFNLAIDWSPYHEDYAAIFTEEWTCINNYQDTTLELYHAASDYHCVNNLYYEENTIADSLNNILLNWMNTLDYSHENARRFVPPADSLSKAAIKDLKTLGYMK